MFFSSSAARRGWHIEACIFPPHPYTTRPCAQLAAKIRNDNHSLPAGTINIVELLSLTNLQKQLSAKHGASKRCGQPSLAQSIHAHFKNRDEPSIALHERSITSARMQPRLQRTGADARASTNHAMPSRASDLERSAYVPKTAVPDLIFDPAIWQRESGCCRAGGGSAGHQQECLFYVRMSPTLGSMRNIHQQ